MKKIVTIVTVFALIGLSTGAAFAESEVDILLRKFVERGIITQDVANEVKGEISQEMKFSGKSKASEPTRQMVKDEVSSQIPDWVKDMELSGDVRLRFQTEKRDSDTDERNRMRARYRLAVESALTDQIKVGGGLASGGSDPRSTNQTLQDSFETPDIRLDLVWAEYSPLEDVSIIGGKFKRKNYLWSTTDMIWDGDINPEGVSAHASTEFLDGVKAYFNTGFWVLDENGKSDDTDPYLKYFQIGSKLKGEIADAQIAAVYYDFEGVKGEALDYCAGTNSGVSSSSSSCSGTLTYDYSSVGVSAEVGVDEPFDLPIPRVALIGDYINNISDGVEKDTGWAIGTKFGDKKVKEFGQWQFKYLYVKLEADAFADAFPDSDRFGGRTDVKAHEFALTFGLAKNLTLGLDYYKSERLDNSTDEEDLFQADLVFKF